VALEADLVIEKFEEFVGGFIGDEAFKACQIGLDLLRCFKGMDYGPYLG
jgi:hypothetical protein